MLFVVGAIVYDGCTASTEAAATSESQTSSKVILEVINRHFTVGKKIRSVYLRVFSDGTGECHTEKYSDEPDIMKKKMLARKDFEALRTVLQERELSTLKHRYERMYPVVDSWMEWNIKISDHGPNRKIEVAGFSPSAAKKQNQPYPDVLVRLGCSIWKLRDEIYGEEQATMADHAEECNQVWGKN
jgi:hypothetical protein